LVRNFGFFGLKINHLANLVTSHQSPRDTGLICAVLRDKNFIFSCKLAFKVTAAGLDTGGRKTLGKVKRVLCSIL
jgi:hypothetical protein